MVSLEELKAQRDAINAALMANVERDIDAGIRAANKAGQRIFTYQTPTSTLEPSQGLGDRYKNAGFEVSVAPGVVNSQTVVTFVLKW